MERVGEGGGGGGRGRGEGDCCPHVHLDFPRRAVSIAEILSHCVMAGLRPQPGRKAGRACACACAGRAQRPADNGQTCTVGCCAADVECSFGAAEAAAEACPTAQSAASCACAWACTCASVQKIGREGAAAVASRQEGLVGLVDVLRHHFHQSPSRRPGQWERLQWPFRVHLCGGVVIKAPDGGRKRRARGEQGVGKAHRHSAASAA